MKDYQYHKKHIGMGGIRCPCCRKLSLKDTRIALNRMARRKTKQLLKQE